MKSKTPIIIHISQYFLPAAGGLERSINDIVQGIKNDNIDNEIICGSDPQITKEEITNFDKNYNVPIFRIKNPIFAAKITKYFNSVVGGTKPLDFKGRLAMILFSFLNIKSFLSVLTQRTIEHYERPIFFHSYSMTSLALIIFIKKILNTIGKKDVEATFTNGFVYGKSGFAIFDYIITKVFKNTDGIFCVSEVSASSLIKNFSVPKNKINTYNNWLTNGSRKLLFNKNKILSNKIKVLFVGRTVPEKGISEIISLARYLYKNRLHNYEITIIGNSNHPIVNDIIQADKELPELKFLGYVQKPKLWEHYKINDIFLMLSNWKEGFGNTSIEAYAAGLPVIGTNKGAIPSTLKQFPLYEIVEQTDPMTLLEAINRVYYDLHSYGFQKFNQASQNVLDNNFSQKNVIVYNQYYQKKIAYYSQ